MKKNQFKLQLFKKTKLWVLGAFKEIVGTQLESAGVRK